MTSPRDSRRPAWTGFIDNLAPPLGRSERKFFQGKRILITGAGGYLGSAIARTLARYRPGHLLLLDSAEYGLFRLGQYLRENPLPVDFSLVVGSVNDQALLHDLFTRTPPDLVFHAAACKHVPLMEDNPFAAAAANSLSTLALVEAAASARTATFLLLSTDKAVEPRSVMGATKRIAEQVVLRHMQDHAQYPDSATRFKALRLCNILGSTGSVAPLFDRQLRAGQALTVTHPDVTRFFVTRREAVRLVLRATLDDMPDGLLVANVPEPRRIEDLARFLFSNAPSPFAEPAITYSGLRPADKLHERLLSRFEEAIGSESPLLQAVNSPFSSARLHEAIAELKVAVATRDHDRLFAALTCAVPDFQPRVQLRLLSSPKLTPVNTHDHHCRHHDLSCRLQPSLLATQDAPGPPGRRPSHHRHGVASVARVRPHRLRN